MAANDCNEIKFYKPQAVGFPSTLDAVYLMKELLRITNESYPELSTYLDECVSTHIPPSVIDVTTKRSGGISLAQKYIEFFSRYSTLRDKRINTVFFKFLQHFGLRSVINQSFPMQFNNKEDSVTLIEAAIKLAPWVAHVLLDLPPEDGLRLDSYECIKELQNILNWRKMNNATLYKFCLRFTAKQLNDHETLLLRAFPSVVYRKVEMAGAILHAAVDLDGSRMEIFDMFVLDQLHSFFSEARSSLGQACSDDLLFGPPTYHAHQPHENRMMWRLIVDKQNEVLLWSSTLRTLLRNTLLFHLFGIKAMLNFVEQYIFHETVLRLTSQ